MTPRFDRTRKFAQPHAMLAVDGTFTVLWLSAFATQASFNAKNLCGKACGVSKGVVGLGVFITYVFHPLSQRKPQLLTPSRPAACSSPVAPSSVLTP